MILIVVKDKFYGILYIINFSSLIGFYDNLRVTYLAHSVYEKCCRIIQLTKTVLFWPVISQIIYFGKNKLLAK